MDDLLDQLRASVGADHVLTEDADVAAYVVDWTGTQAGRALAVVRPGSTEEVAAVVAACAGAGVPVVPQGGNTGLVGGGVPDASGSQVVLFGHAIDSPFWGYVAISLAGTLGYLLGSIVGWGIGAYGGRPLIEGRGRWLHLTPENFARAEEWFDRRGDADRPRAPARQRPPGGRGLLLRRARLRGHGRRHPGRALRRDRRLPPPHRAALSRADQRAVVGRRRRSRAAAGRARAGTWPTEDTTVAQVLSVYDELTEARPAS